MMMMMMMPKRSSDGHVGHGRLRQWCPAIVCPCFLTELPLAVQLCRAHRWSGRWESLVSITLWQSYPPGVQRHPLWKPGGPRLWSTVAGGGAEKLWLRLTQRHHLQGHEDQVLSSLPSARFPTTPRHHVLPPSGVWTPHSLLVLIDDYLPCAPPGRGGRGSVLLQHVLLFWARNVRDLAGGFRWNRASAFGRESRLYSFSFFFFFTSGSSSKLVPCLWSLLGTDKNLTAISVFCSRSLYRGQFVW